MVLQQIRLNDVQPRAAGNGFIQLAVVIGLNHQDCLSFFNVIRPAIFTDIRPPGSVVL